MMFLSICVEFRPNTPYSVRDFLHDSGSTAGHVEWVLWILRAASSKPKSGVVRMYLYLVPLLRMYGERGSSIQVSTYAV
jgi:hypothetical protein